MPSVQNQRAANQAEADSDDNVHTPLLKSISSTSYPSSWTERVATSFQDWFSWDLLSAAVATVSIVAIIILLAVFDNSSLPDWPSIITVC